MCDLWRAGGVSLRGEGTHVFDVPGTTSARGETVTDIMPTFRCFDDALELINERVLEDPALARGDTLRLVHGIAGVEKDGTPYAHAWVEEGGLCWDAGLVDGQRIYYAVKQAEFYEARQIAVATKYTVRQACLENLRSGHYGPWVEAYRKLCGGGGDRVVGKIAATYTPKEES
jgi:hypothetical protein